MAIGRILVFILWLIHHIHKINTQILVPGSHFQDSARHGRFSKLDFLKKEIKILHKLLREEVLQKMNLVQNMQSQNKLISDMEIKLNAVHRELLDKTSEVRYDMERQADLKRKTDILGRKILQEEIRRKGEINALRVELIDIAFANQSVSNKRGYIAFSVRNTKLSSGIIVFQSISINLGNGYNTTSGIFRAPSTGVYVLQWTLVTGKRSNCTTALFVNGEIVSWNWGGSVDNSGSQTIIRKLYKNDQVQIKPTLQGTCTQLHSAWSSFSGFRYV